MMKRLLLLLGVLLLGGCSGGGGGAVPLPAPGNEILHWEQPPYLADNVTPMDIQKDVSRWDVYCTFFSSPVDNDLVASVASPDNLSFDLALLRAHGIEPGLDGKLVFLKCIGIDNEASDFSEPVEWRN